MRLRAGYTRAMTNRMKYIPKLTQKEIEENYRHFSKRILLYKGKGLDFVRSREYILKKADRLHGGILEIGTGTGYTTLALAKAGYKFVSIDNDKEALKTAALNLAYANALSDVEFYIMDGKFMDFENGSFRNIVCMNLFHHVDKVNKMLSEIDRVLCANGRIILADFNKRGMEVVETVHREEGRVHGNSNTAKGNIDSYFRGLGYELNDYDDEYHWVLIGKKLIQK